MLIKLKEKALRSKALLVYFLLTYLDKVISFALPLSVLFIIKDNQLYTFVEVVFSYATIVMVVMELGFSNYLFYGYKNADDKPKFTSQAKVFFRFLILLYGLATLCLFLGMYSIKSPLMELTALICVRSLFTLFVSFYSNIYRLNDKPSGIYLTTIIVNLTSFALLMLAYLLNWNYPIAFFFVPQLAVVLALMIQFLAFEIKLFEIKPFLHFLNEAIKFSWPIILNVLAMTYMNNYAKIYAYDRLSQEETFQVSYVMRVGLIIQLTHASFSSFFSKSIFMDENKTVNYKMLGRYSAVLLFSMALVVVVLLLTNYFVESQINISINLTTFFFLLYILLWCYIGYLEIYFGVLNANRKILFYSVVCSLVYSILLISCKSIHLFELSLFMVLTAVLNLLLVIFGLSKLGMLRVKSDN